MRVLFWSPYSSWPLHAAHEYTIAHALRRRGATVHTLLCNALFPECDIYRRKLLWTPTGRPHNACERCQLQSVHQHAMADNPFTWLGVYVPRDLYARARAFVDALPLDDLTTARWEGQAVGEWAQSSAFYQFRMSTFRLDDPEVVQSVRDHVYGTIVAWEGLRRAWDELQPDVLVTFNGRFFSHRAAVEVARAHGARVVTHERGMERDTFWLHLGDSVFDLSFYERTWADWKDVPLTAAAARQVSGWLHDRRHHRNLGWRPFSPKPQDAEKVRAALRLDERPVVAMFTSSDDEMAAYRDWREGAFPESLAWIPASIELAKRMPEVVWVIRMHPNLVGFGENDQALAQIEELARALPENVRVVMPRDDISSYTLADIAAIGVVYMTTMGLEMAARGQRVVAVARGWYGFADIVDLVTRPEDYEGAVRAALAAPRSTVRAQRTHRFLQRLQLEFSMPFRFIHDPDKQGGAVRRWSRPEDLDQGKDAVLDRICATILEGAPVVAPPTGADRARSAAAELAFLRRMDPALADAPEQPTPTQADLLVTEGEGLYADGDLARARGCFERATACDPEHPDAWMDLGAVLHALDDEVGALRALATALRVDPYRGDAWGSLIAVLLERGRATEARTMLRDALGVLPDDADLLALRTTLGP